MSDVKEQLEFNAIPTLSQVRQFIDCYNWIVANQTFRVFKTNLTEKSFGHFCTATWICNRLDVPFEKFLESIFSYHQKMEHGKVVPPHQLSTWNAEEICLRTLVKEYHPRDDSELSDIVDFPVFENDVPEGDMEL